MIGTFERTHLLSAQIKFPYRKALSEESSAGSNLLERDKNLKQLVNWKRSFELLELRLLFQSFNSKRSTDDVDQETS